MLALPPAHASSAAGLAFVTTQAAGQGVQVGLVVEDTLPIEDVVSLSSVTAEARLSLTRSTALAAIPDPGEDVRTLPGTIGGLSGQGGLPEYPLAAWAEHPLAPSDEVNVGGGSDATARLSAEASLERTSAEARAARVAPSGSSVPVTAASTSAEANVTRLGPEAFEVEVVSEANGIEVLGGALSIAGVRSHVLLRLEAGEVSVVSNETTVAGALVSGSPVAIDDVGIVQPGGVTPIGSLTDTLAAPLDAAGVVVRTTPGSSEVAGATGSASSGTVRIEVPIAAPAGAGMLVIAFGGATARIDAAQDLGPASPVTPPSTAVIAPAPPDRPVTPPSPSEPTTVSRPLAGPVVSPTAAVAAGSPTQFPPLFDLRPLYRALALAAAAAVVLERRVRSIRLRPVRPDLRALWRW